MRRSSISILILISLLISIFYGCTPTEFYPKEGEWYCEELQLQLSFGGNQKCYIIKSGERIRCVCSNDLGSFWLSVLCQDPDSKYYRLGESVFGGEFVRLDQDELVIRDPRAKRNIRFAELQAGI